MFAVVEISSFQYKVSEGDTIATQRLREKEGKTITLDKVLLIADGQMVKIGQPYLKDVKVSAKVVGAYLAKKLVSYRYKRRKGFAKKKGHRQKLTELNITNISYTK